MIWPSVYCAADPSCRRVRGELLRKPLEIHRIAALANAPIIRVVRVFPPTPPLLPLPLPLPLVQVSLSPPTYFPRLAFAATDLSILFLSGGSFQIQASSPKAPQQASAGSKCVGFQGLPLSPSSPPSLAIQPDAGIAQSLSLSPFKYLPQQAARSSRRQRPSLLSLSTHVNKTRKCANENRPSDCRSLSSKSCSSPGSPPSVIFSSPTSRSFHKKLMFDLLKHSTLVSPSLSLSLSQSLFVAGATILSLSQ